MGVSIFYALLRILSKKDNLKPKSVIRLSRRLQAFFLSSFLSLLGYNGTPLRPQSAKKSVQKENLNHHNANDRFGLKG